MVGEHRFGEPPGIRERGQIGLIEGRLAVTAAAYLVGQRLGPLFIATVDQDLCAGGGQFGGDVTSDTVRRPRDQYRLAVHCHGEVPFALTAPARRCRQP